MDGDLKRQVANLPEKPGVYVYYNKNNQVLYVGKAKNLQKRVSSYFKTTLSSNRIALMVSLIDRLEVTLCLSSKDALILESRMIKTLNPQFNVLLKDDKDYPRILITKHDYPRVRAHRGGQTDGGKIFGPYVNSSALYKTLDILQKTFQLRTCRDVEFKNRSRPCLQHQIGRCTAPCVGMVSPEQYQQQVNDASRFLTGKADGLLAKLTEQMQQAAQAQDYLLAARIRDNIASLREVQGDNLGRKQRNRTDIIVLSRLADSVALVQYEMQNGVMVSQRQQIITRQQDSGDANLIADFVSQFYAKPLEQFNFGWPQKILLAQPNDELQWIIDGIASMNKRAKVKLAQAKSSQEKKYLLQLKKPPHWHYNKEHL